MPFILVTGPGGAVDCRPQSCAEDRPQQESRWTAGLISRGPDPADGRRSLLAIAEYGQAARLDHEHEAFSSSATDFLRLGDLAAVLSALPATLVTVATDLPPELCELAESQAGMLSHSAETRTADFRAHNLQ